MATSITDLPAQCLLRVCRWLWPAKTPQSYLPSLEEGGSDAGPALFGLLTSCRALYDLVNQNWVPLFTALLEELFTPLPPDLEANYRHLLSRRQQAEEESEEERRQKDEAHQERLVIHTFFAALAFDSIKKGLASDEAEAKRERAFHIPSQLRQLLRREFAHRASNLNMEAYAARLPDVPRVIKSQPFVSAPTIAYMATPMSMT
ncbi:hypothetical protein QOT17_018437 [Balamuthia mandrillaris]